MVGILKEAVAAHFKVIPGRDLGKPRQLRLAGYPVEPGCTFRAL
jgi:hypothetical protein